MNPAEFVIGVCHLVLLVVAMVVVGCLLRVAERDQGQRMGQVASVFAWLLAIGAACAVLIGLLAEGKDVDAGLHAGAWVLLAGGVLAVLLCGTASGRQWWTNQDRPVAPAR